MGLVYSAREATFLVSMSRSSLDILGPELAEALVSELRGHAARLGRPQAVRIGDPGGQSALLADPDVITDLPERIASLMERNGRKGIVVDTVLADLKDMALHLQHSRGIHPREFHDRPDVFEALADTGYPPVDATAPTPDDAPEP